MTPTAPIGVFDSGFGGLSVLHAIRSALPAEALLYCADHAYLPYGERDAPTVLARSRYVAGALVAAGAKGVVIACNTATAIAADPLRRELSVPVIGMEPAVKPAATATGTGVIGVLGTGGTLASSRFAGLLERYAGQVEVVTRPCPELVAVAENGALALDQRQRLVDAAVAPLLAAGADVLVLGCTHFAFLRREIEQAVGSGVDIIDTGPAVAQEVARRLEVECLLRPATGGGGERFWTSGDCARVQGALHHLWGAAAQIEPLPQRPATESAAG